MNAGTWLLPALALLSGLVSLQIDPAREPRKKWILVAMLLLSALGTVLISVQDDHAKQAETLEAQQNEKYFRDRLTDLTGKSTQIIGLLQSAGFSPQTIQKVQQAQAADLSRGAILDQTQAASRQNKAQVWYFPRDVDGPRVVSALEQGGFQVLRKSGRAGNESLPTNAIWTGDQVSLDQAKFVALTLIRAGVEIKALRRLQNGSGPRSSLIEVGSDAALQNQPPLTVEAVTNLAALPPR